MAGTSARITGPINSGSRLYFTPFRPLSHPDNARNLVEKKLFYMSADRFDVFGFFNNFIALKPAIMQRSSDLIAARFSGLPEVLVKEAAAGTGESLKILLESMQKDHPQVYKNTRAVASDGYPAVVDSMRSSDLLAPLVSSGKLKIALEDVFSPTLSPALADYVRLSCVLCELPEDTVRVEGGKYSLVNVRGYIEGRQDFTGVDGRTVDAGSVRNMLESGSLQKLIDQGLLPPVLNPRIKYEYVWGGLDFSPFGADAGPVKTALDKITAGIRSAEFKLGFSAAKAAENILKYHLKDRNGSFIELFDSWTAGIYENMPCAILDYGLTTVTHPNYPFLDAYLDAKQYGVSTRFENWYEYTKRTEPYIYIHPFYKWLKGADKAAFSAFFGRDIWGDNFEGKKQQLIGHISTTQLKYEEVLESETDHIFVRHLKDACGFRDEDISRIFKSGSFIEKDYGRSDGFYGNYQVVTVERK